MNSDWTRRDLEDGDPGVPDVVEWDGVVEWIVLGDAARRVVAVPVDARSVARLVVVGGPLVDAGVAAGAVERQRQ